MIAHVLQTLSAVLAITSPVSRALVGGCGQGLPAGQIPGDTFNVSITSDGLRRSYLVFVPPTYDSSVPTPLILSYHGGNRNASSQQQLDLLTEPEFNTNSFVVYPQGIDGLLGNPCYETQCPYMESWQGVPGVTINDTLFTTDILNALESTYCIDTTRISATGKSDGGGFCNVLACDPTLSSRIAAFAPVSGAYYVDTLPCQPDTIPIPCNPSRTDVPMLAFHGGNDTTIAFLGGKRKGECLPTIPHFIQEWALRDGLGSTNTTVPVATDTVFYQFGEDATAGLVGLYFESNIGHDWPSTQPNADNRVSGHHVANYNATPIILDFFGNHPLPVGDTV